MKRRLWNLNALSTELQRDRRSLARALDDLAPDQVDELAGGRQSRKYFLANVVAHLYAPAPATDPDDLDLEQQRARHSKEQADKLALENAVARGELIYTTHMAQVMGRALEAFRARLLSAASKLAPRVNPGNPNLARDLIQQEHIDVLAELSVFDPGEDTADRKQATRRKSKRSKSR